MIDIIADVLYYIGQSLKDFINIFYILMTIINI